MRSEANVIFLGTGRYLIPYKYMLTKDIKLKKRHPDMYKNM